MPTTAADIATAIHDANPGCNGRRLSVNKALAKTPMQRTSPLAIWSFQNGWLLMASPAGYFGLRSALSNKPQ
jgi:hypothetical protein